MENVTVAKAEKKLKTLTEKVGASEEGRMWMENCLDPFCDRPRRAVGFPDLITGNSIVQVVKQTVQYTNTTSGPTDVHIFNDNVDQSVTLGITPLEDGTSPAGTNHLGYVFPGGPATTRRGGVVVRAAATNTPLNSTHVVAQSALPASYYAGGSTRILSKAFEVHNTSPPLQQGGAVIVYRDSTTPGTNPPIIASYTRSVTDVHRDFPVYPLADVPETAADCFRLPGAQQWEAKDGCYVVSMMSSQTNQPEDDPRGLLQSHDSGNSAGDDWVSYAVPFIQLSGSGPYIPYLDATLAITPSPFFVSGAYFTNIPVGSSLQVNTIWIIERFVDHTNRDLVVMASPSPSFDPVALELYSKTAHRMPAGVKVDMNDDGDWIKTIADTLGDFGVPGMGVVKGAVNVGQKLFGQKDMNKTMSEIEALTARVEKLERLCEALERRSGNSNMNVPKYLPAPVELNNTPKKTNPPQNKITDSLKVQQQVKQANQSLVPRSKKTNS